jgi:hypothetical protein
LRLRDEQIKSINIMAKFTNNIYTPNMRGKTGDIVFGRNRHGSFMRKSPVRTKPFTPYELTRQEAFSILSPIWSSIEENDRELWILKGRDETVATKLGNPNIKTGWNLFHSVNLTLLAAGEEAISKAPIFKNAQEFKYMNIQIEQIKRKKELILETMPGIGKDTIVVIYGTKAMSPGIMSINPGEYKIFATVDSDTETYKDSKKINLTESYEKRFGRLPICRQKVSFLIKPMNRHCAISSYPKTVTFIYRDEAESAIEKE